MSSVMSNIISVSTTA